MVNMLNIISIKYNFNFVVMINGEKIMKILSLL